MMTLNAIMGKITYKKYMGGLVWLIKHSLNYISFNDLYEQQIHYGLTDVSKINDNLINS